jgi:hypothetical protein
VKPSQACDILGALENDAVIEGFYVKTADVVIDVHPPVKMPDMIVVPSPRAELPPLPMLFAALVLAVVIVRVVIPALASSSSEVES